MLRRATRKATVTHFLLVLDTDDRLLIVTALACLSASRETPHDLVPQVRILLRRLLALGEVEDPAKGKKQ